MTIGKRIALLILLSALGLVALGSFAAIPLATPSRSRKSPR